MAFYTADWVRSLLKEDHKEVISHITKKGNDFRSYIDTALPFTLYLNISDIVSRILNPNALFIQELAELLQLTDNNILIDELASTYKRVIDFYINNKGFTNINSDELQDKLNALNASIGSGNIRGSLSSMFSKTMVVTNVSKPGISVLLIFPRFRTISDRFGKDFKDNFDYNKFSDIIPDNLNDSPRNIVKNYLSGNFGKLQNLGHIEVDILSSTSSEVKRGLVSPRLLQALTAMPSGVSPSTIARQFSTYTGQATTRLVVRKMFNNSKLVLEMLIENGMMIGIPESQKENLIKAGFERSFEIGAGLTKELIKNPDRLQQLETSKSISQHVFDSVLNMLGKGKKVDDYTSNTSISVSSAVKYTTVKIALPKATSTSAPLARLRNTQGQFYSIASLQTLINELLPKYMEKNMGKGDSKVLLNYRSGRLANSPKVERMSVSREGMISAFYSYMRNPYGTFSQGGAQSQPPSRDPKLLISKSIREIAQTKVTNRMRAILV